MDLIVATHLKILATKILILFILIILIAPSGLAVEPKGSIRSVKASGTANIENLISDNDQIEFIVTASIEGDAKLEGNLFLYHKNSQIGAFTCKDDPVPLQAIGSSSLGGQVCSLKFPAGDKGTFKEREQKFTIYLISDPNENKQVINLAKKEVTLLVDNTAPTVSLFEIKNVEEFEKKKFSSSGKVNLNFDVADFGFNENPDECAGIKSVEFYLGKISDNKKLFECLGDCLDSGCKVTGKTKEYRHEGTGEVMICAKAIDKVDKKSQEKCDTFTVDKDAPKIIKESKKITDLADKPISNIAPGKPIRAKFSIDIVALDISAEGVTADFSELNPDNSELKSKSPTRVIPNEKNKAVTTFIWDIEINLKSEGTKKVTISAGDKFGNNLKPEDSAVDVVFAKDDAGPVIKSLKTERPAFENNYYASSIENFIAEIEDTTGVSGEDIILHVESGGLKKSFAAKECKGDKPIICKWLNINLAEFRDGQLNVFIDSDSKDILGNPVKDRAELKVILDKTMPGLKDIKVLPKPTGPQTPATSDFKTGDILEILISAEDSNKLIVTADLTQVIINAVKEDIPCEKTPQDNVWVCKKQTTAIDRTGAISAKLKFTLTDVAGNSKEEIYPITVIATKDLPEKPFFELRIIDDKIQPIDLSVLASMAREDYQQIIPIKLRDTGICSGGAELINPRLTCSELPKNGIVLGNKQRDGYNGYVEFFITKDAVADKDEFSIGATNSCIISYNTKCSDTFYKQAEQQKLRVNVFVSRETLTPAEVTKQDIEIIKEEVKGWGSLIDSLDKAKNGFEKICDLKHAYASTLKAISAVGIVVGACADSQVDKVLAGGTCEGIEKALSKLFGGISNRLEKNKLNEFINTACGYLKCTSTEVEPSAIKDFAEYYPQKRESPQNQQGSLKSFIEGGNLCDTLRRQIIDKNDILYITNLGAGALPKTNLEMAKKSWLYSIGCACIPGIVVNLQKARQIKCQKAICLQDIVPTGIVTPDYCQREYAFNNCKYTVGQYGGIFFDIIIGNAYRAVLEVAEHPIASFWEVIKHWYESRCKKDCSFIGSGDPAGVKCTVKWVGFCGRFGYAGMLAFEHTMQGFDRIKAATDRVVFTSSIQPDYCDILNKQLSTKEEAPTTQRQTFAEPKQTTGYPART